MARHELGQAVTLSLVQSSGPHRTVRKSRLPSGTPGNDALLFKSHLAGVTSFRQHDRCADLAVGAGVLTEALNQGPQALPLAWGTLIDRLNAGQRLDVGAEL